MTSPSSSSSSKHSLVIGVVGKPSVGKSSFLNSTTCAKAKVGNYPFTTIEPNRAIHLHRSPCICSLRFPHHLHHYCQPRSGGSCIDGTRYIPIDMLDVAGLIPGASQGLGLGNRFLDDLRTAHVLIHVVDVSGTTNEKGERTEGYDPSHDIDWLNNELHAWIFQNLWHRWSSIVSRHVRKKSTMVETLLDQLSGYGCNKRFIIQLCEQLNLTFSHFSSSSHSNANDSSTVVASTANSSTTYYPPMIFEGMTENMSSADNHNPPPRMRHMIETWDERMCRQFVWDFLTIRFPTVYALNKIDMKASAKNIDKLYRRYGPVLQERMVLTSALSEIFLRKMAQDGYIHYVEGSDSFVTLVDLQQEQEQEQEQEQGEDGENEKRDTEALKPITNEKHVQMLDNVRDLVLYRYGSTGVYQTISKAVELQQMITIYPILGGNGSGSSASPSIASLVQMEETGHVSEQVKKQGLFHDVFMVRSGTSIRSFVHKAYRPIFDRHAAQQQQQQQSSQKPMSAVKWYCEAEDGRRLGDTETLTKDGTLLRVVFE